MKLVYQFSDLQDLFWMNGHGPFVWTAYVITFAAMGGLIWSAHVQRKSFLRQQSAIHRRSDAAETSKN